MFFMLLAYVPCVCARAYTRENVVSASMSGRRTLESVHAYVRS